MASCPKRFTSVKNSSDNTISAFRIGSTGALTPLKGSPFPSGAVPAAMAICEVKGGKCVPVKL